MMAEDFIFYLKQNIGSPSQAVVKAGDTVERGELIAAKPKSLGANLHSSVTGRVLQVTEKEIVIRETGTDFSSYKKLEGKTPWELVVEAGLIGLGGAGFPTDVKLRTRLSSKGTAIINAVECEPVLAHNIARIEEDAEKLLEALQIILELLQVKIGMIAIKKIHKKAIAALKTADKEKRYQIVELEDMYPTGEERAIIRDTLHILLPTDALPSQADAVIFNAETALRIREAIVEKKPLIDKDITVAGKLKENASIRIIKNVPVGKKVSGVFEQAGGLNDEFGEIIMGGPFTGKRTTPEEAVQKTTGGLIVSECFFHETGSIGLLVCACGADERRLEEIAVSMGSRVCGTEYCKQAVKHGEALKCENPGHCPGQVEKIMKLKKAGAEAVLISNCTDCTNTVMSCAPKLGLKVFHCTDQVLRAVNHRLIRKYHKTEENQ